jgi:mevalonate pyrophosphate decarboxylase
MSRSIKDYKKAKRTYQERLHEINKELETLLNICQGCERFDCEDCYERMKKESLRMEANTASSRLKFVKTEIKERKKEASRNQ